MPTVGWSAPRLSLGEREEITLGVGCWRVAPLYCWSSGSGYIHSLEDWWTPPQTSNRLTEAYPDSEGM